MQRLKKIANTIHLWLGLVSGLVVFIVSLTGCLYVFEEELRDIFQPQYFYVTAEASGKKKLEDLSTTIKKHYPDEEIASIRFKEAANAAVIYYTRSDKAISVNPYTAQIIGERYLKADFFNFILSIHLRLRLGEVGEQIIRWNVLIFFILCLTGFILWIPRRWKGLKQAIIVNWKLKNWRALSWNLHSTLGFYGLLVLLIISATGIFWMFDSAKSFVSIVTGTPITQTKAPEITQIGKKETATMENAYDIARKLYPGALQTFLSNPEKPNQPIRVLFRYPYTIVRKQNTLFFDRYTGEILREDLHKNYTAYDKVMRSNFDFHTGRIPALGIGSKIIYFLAALFAASLPVTGFMIWWSKKKSTIRNPKLLRRPVVNNF